MGHSNGLITAPVSIADAKTVLGVSDNSLGTLIYDAGDSGTTNIFARYKPVYHSGIGPLDESAMTDNEHNVGTNSQVRYGIKRFKPTTLTVSRLKDGWDGWDYDYPQGGTNAPYRLTDFNNYNHKAPKPFGFMWPPDLEIPIGDTPASQSIIGFRLNINWAMMNFNPATCLSLCQVTVNGTSFAGILTSTESKMYPAVALMPKDSTLTTDMYIASSGITLENVAKATQGENFNGTTVKIDTGDLSDAYGSTSTYFTEGKKWIARFMLVQYDRTGKDVNPGNCVSLEGADYYRNFTKRVDAQELTVVRVQWLKFVKKVTMTTAWKRVSTNKYQIDSVSISVTKQGSPGTSIPIGVKFWPVCVPGTVDGENPSLENGIDGRDTFVISNESSTTITKTFPSTLFTGMNIYYIFDSNPSIPEKRAILNASFYYSGKTSIEVATNVSCLSGASTYTNTGTWTNPNT